MKMKSILFLPVFFSSFAIASEPLRAPVNLYVQSAPNPPVIYCGTNSIDYPKLGTGGCPFSLDTEETSEYLHAGAVYSFPTDLGACAQTNQAFQPQNVRYDYTYKDNTTIVLTPQTFSEPYTTDGNWIQYSPTKDIHWVCSGDVSKCPYKTS